MELSCNFCREHVGTEVMSPAFELHVRNCPVCRQEVVFMDTMYGQSATA
ncbi:MAG: hypothetical protein ACYDDF_04320 [Thermoplasmatota archaeon]